MSTKLLLIAQSQRLTRWLMLKFWHSFSSRRLRSSRECILLLFARTMFCGSALMFFSLLVPLLLVQGNQQIKSMGYHEACEVPNVLKTPRGLDTPKALKPLKSWDRLGKLATPKVSKMSPHMATTQPMVRVYLSDTCTVESVPLEKYVRGVIAAEMPGSFEIEAFKAQAMAARTYIFRRLLARDTNGIPRRAHITNTAAQQAYKPLAEMERLAKSTVAKLDRAIAETRDLIIIYKGKPIVATFFSSSNGYTENAEDYWGNWIPYLRSVASPWDKQVTPQYANHVELKINNLLSKLGLPQQAITRHRSSAVANEPAARQAVNRQICILSYTAGKRAGKVRVGPKHFTGREIREKLGLRSSAFHWNIEGDKLIITTYGFGHGVGMSQYGAQGMAKRGATAEQIITYYYKGVKLDKASKFITPITVASFIS